ncbi:15874_t:CDS:2 [Cetraspora pellucida]|uniref:15874_t:CDS:1 n=1 Tax=Cetraspora pellucida TaxID=1433469 RepID=A0A9N9AGZ1_9GLOM|nr:15874_t:CDS:2 [Cetraspora pellucida]
MTRPQTSNMFSLLSVTNAKDLSIIPIITNAANNIIENLIIFFLALFISFCGGSSSNNNIAPGAHLIFVPQHHKSLYYMFNKKTSDQDQSQSQLNITDYKPTHKSKKSRSRPHRSTSSHPTTSY